MNDQQPGLTGRIDRRGMLRTAAVAGAGGVGAVVALPSPASAHVQAMQVIDVKAHGAVGDGLTDDHAALQAALNEVPINRITTSPNVVYFPPGDYVVSRPLVPRPNTLMLGTHTTDVLGDLAPTSRCKIRVRSNFVGTALIMPTSDPNSYTVGLTIRNLALVGNGVGTNIAGIRFPDSDQVSEEQATCLEDVTISAFSGDGITGRISVLSMIQCMVVRNRGWGVNAGGTNGRWTDGHITGCYFSFNETGNLLLGGPTESGAIEVVNTRFERAGGDPVNVSGPVNPAAPGIRITGALSIRFTNCSTDANMGNGVEIVHDSTSPAWSPHHIQFVNCSFMRDGTGDQLTLGNYAGFKVLGAGANEVSVHHVMCVNCVVAPGKADDGGGGTITGPKRGVWYENSSYFQWIGGHVDGQVSDYYTGSGGNYRPQIMDHTTGLLTLPRDEPDAAAAAPDGSVYFDNSTSTLKVRSNGVWKSVTLT